MISNAESWVTLVGVMILGYEQDQTSAFLTKSCQRMSTAAIRCISISLCPVVSLSVGILHEWMWMQMLAKPSLNLLQRTAGNHRGGCRQPGWRTFMMTCLRWILGYMKREIWRKIGLSRDWCLCIVLCTCTVACNYWLTNCVDPYSARRRGVSGRGISLFCLCSDL